MCLVVRSIPFKTNKKKKHIFISAEGKIHPSHPHPVQSKARLEGSHRRRACLSVSKYLMFSIHAMHLVHFPACDASMAEDRITLALGLRKGQGTKAAGDGDARRLFLIKGARPGSFPGPLNMGMLLNYCFFWAGKQG